MRNALFLFFALFLIICSGAVSGESKSIIDLQAGRTESSVRINGPIYESATLINLNPRVNVWYVLQLKRVDKTVESYHLENAYPERQRLELSEKGRELILVEDTIPECCRMWLIGIESTLLGAHKMQRPFVELCEGRLYLRNTTEGKRTRKEWMADLLRDRVKYGEQITNFIKEKFFRDKYRQTGQRKRQTMTDELPSGSSRPSRIRIKSYKAGFTLTTPELNLKIAEESGGGMDPGRWYPVTDYPGIFVSVVTPELIPDVADWTKRGLSSPLEEKEASALVYLVAFDLSLFDLHYALGTDHPRVGWSDRAPESSRNMSIPGPDGFDNVSPLVRTGKVNPRNVGRAAAAFAAGFKRSHGAFKWGKLATENNGSHYGFVEDGVVFSSLQPGLATLIVYTDGRVDIRTWRSDDRFTNLNIMDARQNGVSLLERDPLTGAIRPGNLVGDWAGGNWSGSESKQLRTLRAGACIQETGETRFLIYGYFTAATPSAMARVFNACGCEYAMHLDMNAPEHTYLAIYRVEGSQFVMQRLVKEMAEVDPPVDGQELPRYIGYADNRDFFYLLRKSESPE